MQAIVATLDHTTQQLDRRTFTSYLLHGTPGPDAFGPKLECLEFRGAGVIDGVFYTRKTEVERLCEKRGDISQLINLMKTASGSFTLVIFDKSTRDLYFLNDPLGGGFLLRYGNSSFTAVSTDLTSLRQVSHAYGNITTRNYMYELSGFATGTQSNAGGTPFEEISVQESGSGIRISSEGKVQFLEYGVDEILYSGGEMDEDCLIEQGVEQIRTNISAVLDYSPQLIVSDITGGFDSRLVLAGISALKACDSVVLRSIKHIDEWEYAEGLANTYKMELTADSAFGEVWGIKQDLYEDSVAGARKSGGLIANEMGRNAVPYPVVKFQGGYGGTFRTTSKQFYPDGQEVDTLEIAKGSWKWGRMTQFTVGGERLFQDTINDILGRRAARTYNKGIDQGVPNSHLLSYGYAKGRLRYWFGQQSYHASRPIAQFDPLYNIPLIAAAYRTGFERRRANIIGLKAMRLLDRDLLEYPFYNPGVPSKKFLEEHPEVKQKGFGATPYVYRRLHYSPVERRKIDLRRDEITRNDQERSDKLSLKPEHIAGLRVWGKVAYDRITEDSSLRSFFNHGALRTMLLDPGVERGTTQTAIDFLGALFRAGILIPNNRSKQDEVIFSG